MSPVTNGTPAKTVTSWEDDIWGSILDGAEVRRHTDLRNFLSLKCKLVVDTSIYTGCQCANITIFTTGSNDTEYTYTKECTDPGYYEQQWYQPGIRRDTQHVTRHSTTTRPQPLKQLFASSTIVLVEFVTLHEQIPSLVHAYSKRKPRIKWFNSPTIVTIRAQARITATAQQ
jgi:hypothetical protein